MLSAVDIGARYGRGRVSTIKPESLETRHKDEGKGGKQASPAPSPGEEVSRHCQE